MANVEPVHPRYNPRFRDLSYHAYRRVDEDDPRLEALMRRVLTGRMTHWWIDQTNHRLTYRGLIVKDIYAGLLAAWATARMPWVKPVLLLRHPLSVALSKQQKKRRDRFRWPDRLELLTRQPALMADHLTPFASALDAAFATGDFVVRQVAMWAVIHYVLFRQFSPEGIRIVFYEDVVDDPVTALAPVFDFAGLPPVVPDAEQIARPSIVSSAEERAVRSSAAWQSVLSTVQIASCRAVLTAFGLDDLYDDAGQPGRAALARFPVGDVGAVQATC